MSDEQTTTETDGTRLKVTTYNARPLKAADDMLACLREIIDYTGGADNALDDDYVMARARAAIAQAEAVNESYPTIVGYVVSNASGSYDREEVFPTYDEALRYWEEGDAIGAVLSDDTVTFEV